MTASQELEEEKESLPPAGVVVKVGVLACNVRLFLFGMQLATVVVLRASSGLLTPFYMRFPVLIFTAR